MRKNITIMKRYIKSSLHGHVYFYEGPVYRFGKLYENKVIVYTSNPRSYERAKSILYYKARLEVGLPRDARIELDDNLIDEVNL